MPLGGILFQGCTSGGGVYVPCIYSHASESYCRQLRSLLLCLCVMSFGC